jgi:hypothetical protein
LTTYGSGYWKGEAAAKREKERLAKEAEEKKAVSKFRARNWVRGEPYAQPQPQKYGTAPKTLRPRTR